MDAKVLDFSAANSLLTQIRRRLAEEDGAAWGPEDEQPVVGHLEGEPGDNETGADNVSDLGDVLDKYLSGIVSALMSSHDLSEDEAFEYIVDVADDLAAQGTLPALPDDDSDLEAYAAWYGQANSVKFDAYVMTAANRDFSES